ncbi:ubiquitin-conjugating enzyme E2-binding protein 1 [Aphelenchoides avenae]|nr:ubiquitin-conjugating enzyme E2-binding protein 1 [Aphelenchus avenae]
MDDSDDYEDYSDSPDDEPEQHGGPSTIASAAVTILTPAQLVQEMSQLARETASVIGLTEAVCRLLLHQFKWNKEKVLERHANKYYEFTDAGEFFRSVNVIDPATAPSRETNSGTCTICFEEDALTGLGCGHCYCLDCWNLYISNKVRDEAQAYFACPEPKCSILLDDDAVRRLVRDSRTLETYDRLLVEAFVIVNRLLKWCPGNDCGRVAKAPHVGCQRVECDCGTVFCFDCSFEWHDPVSCELLKLWLKKCSDDSETFNWISANTKDCPQCKMPIEKNGGCNRILCQKCKFEFCWMCLNVWSVHGYNPCNRFNEDQVKQAQSDQERARALLERYLHYFNRFKNHQESLKLEKKLYAKAQVMQAQMQAKNFSWVETHFLKRAVDVLGDCRRTLQYTYAFAYYLEPSNIKHIFEDNQQDLEQATEQLSGFMERDLADEDLVTLKQKVQDKCHYVEQRRLKLLQHCAEGKEKDEWQFSVPHQ